MLMMHVSRCYHSASVGLSETAPLHPATPTARKACAPSVPPPHLPLSGPSHPPTRWGLLTVLINYDAVAKGHDRHLEGLRERVGGGRRVREQCGAACQLHEAMGRGGPGRTTVGF